MISAVVQGGLIRRLVPRFGEPRLILVGIAGLSAGLAGLALTHSVAALLVAGLVVAVGQGLCSPTVIGLLSRITPGSEQGAVFGVLISAQTLARMVNYIAANRLLDQYGPAAPYWEGALVALVALGLAVWLVVSMVGFNVPSDPSSRKGELAAGVAEG